MLPNNTSSRTSRGALLGGLLLAFSVVAVPSLAQQDAQAKFIIRPQPDSNGVDLVTGGMYIPGPSITAPGAGKMQFTTGSTEKGEEINSLRISLTIGNENPETAWPILATVVANGTSSLFTCYGGDLCLEHTPRHGATLVFQFSDPIMSNFVRAE